MKFLLKATLCLLAFIQWIAPQAAEAQTTQRTSDGLVEVTVKRMQRSGSVFNVDLDLRLLQPVRSAKKLEIAPQLTGNGESMDLESLTFLGKDQMRAHRRHMALRSAKKAEKEGTPNVEVGYDAEHPTTSYHATVPYSPWMDKADLQVRSILCDCDGTPGSEGVAQFLAQDAPELPEVKSAYAFKPHLAFITPEIEEPKVRNKSGNANLVFASNRWALRSDLGDNQRELHQLKALVGDVQNDGYSQILSIELAGYASPEGPQSNNLKLCENRAAAIADYLAGEYGVRRSLFTAHAGGEDWDSLAALVRQDTVLDEKFDVLNIIDGEPDVEARKAQLKNLNYGQPYRYLLETYYPQLRRVAITVNYMVKPFSVEEAREVINRQPQNLSLNEMFLLANDYKEKNDMNSFAEVFETSVRMFPDNPVANLNAALAELELQVPKRTERACTYLSRIANTPLAQTPEYFNAMGICAATKGDYEQARQYFSRCEALPAAQLNLQELTKLEQQ